MHWDYRRLIEDFGCLRGVKTQMPKTIKNYMSYHVLFALLCRRILTILSWQNVPHPITLKHRMKRILNISCHFCTNTFNLALECQPHA